MTTGLLKKATNLPVLDRIKLVEDIWDSIADEPDEIPLTEAQKRELSRRMELMRKNPDRALPWSEAKRRILKRRSKTK
ncbi:MAG TPA: addiction module protein [Candidatus Angelobacter sp.]|nr:addiction module protein [Candidatus Angelobacter sp.]